MSEDLKLFRTESVRMPRFDFHIHLSEMADLSYLSQTDITGGVVIFDELSEKRLDELPEGKDWRVFRSGTVGKGQRGDGLYFQQEKQDRKTTRQAVQVHTGNNIGTGTDSRHAESYKNC